MADQTSTSSNDNGLEPALSYARISEDPLGLELGVGDQLAGNRTAAPRFGVRIVAEFRDDNISALKGAKRDGYDSLVQAIRDRQARVIICYQTSRLWRNRAERAAAIELFGQFGVRIVAVRGTPLDLSTASGRGLAGLLGEFDTMESEIKSERVRDASNRRAASGQAAGICPYGWAREYITDDRGRRLGFRDIADPDKAKIVRWIVDELTAGRSIKKIVEDLNQRQAPAPGGGLWQPSSVRKIALRPANIALRIHRGEIVGPANWPPIVDPDKHAQVCALLADPSRVTSRSGARKHLLTYNTEIGRCGVCDGPLRVSKVGKYLLYSCIANTACVGRNQERVDGEVENVVIGLLARPDARTLFDRKDTRAAEARTRAEGLRAKLAAAADDYAEDLINQDQLRRITARLRPQLADAEEEARQIVVGVGPELIVGLTSGPLEDRRGRWHALEAAQQQKILQVLRLRVRILPTRQGPGFDRASVEIKPWEDAAP